MLLFLVNVVETDFSRSNAHEKLHILILNSLLAKCMHVGDPKFKRSTALQPIRVITRRVVLGRESGQQEVDEASVVRSTHSAPMTDTSPEGGEAPALDTLTGLERFYNVADTVGADVDQQLATIVTNLAKNRLPEEKLKEKLATYVRPGNCEALTVTRVNGEIWEKLSATTKSRDLKAQRGQNATVQTMVAITTAADNLVVGTRSGETLSQEKMAVTLTGLVDALYAWLRSPR